LLVVGGARACVVKCGGAPPLWRRRGVLDQYLVLELNPGCIGIKIKSKITIKTLANGRFVQTHLRGALPLELSGSSPIIGA
jgi:hypothetical protein